jgi:ADP-ribosylglycohydrolase
MVLRARGPPRAAVFLARTGKIKGAIKRFIVDRFGYDLDRTLNEIRFGYEFDVTCQGSVPEAIIAFLESSDYEDTVRLAVSIGDDSDTIACITGGIAEAFLKILPTLFR